MKSKYSIKKEFYPFNKFTAPRSRFMINLSHIFMKPPRFLFKDKLLNVKTIKIPGYKNELVTLYIISRKDINSLAPALIFIHGGGFVFEGSTSHYKNAIRFAKECACKVIFVRYNLAPKYPFPYQQEECYKAYQYVFEHADELDIDINNIGITGDSGGATLSVTSMLLSHHRNYQYLPKFQLLVYPWLDKRGNSESNKKYTDTPMWNSRLSKNTGRFTNPNKIDFPPYYNSPVEYPDLSFLPPAYIEVAEFDCLHDDGVLYKELLEKENIPVTFYEVKGTMHGFDTKYKAPTSIEMMNKRIEFINKMFNE